MIPELEYIERLIKFRLNKYYPSDDNLSEPEIPTLDKWQLPLAGFIHENKLYAEEAILLLLALSPHIRPELFDATIDSKMNGSGDFPKIGGVRGKNFRGFLPTGETALFLLTGGDELKRQEVLDLFRPDHLFAEKKIVWLEDLPPGEPAMSGKIIMSQDYVDLFTQGKNAPPHFSMNFPATLLQTDLTWNDLVIDKELQQQIQDIVDWLQFNDQLMDEWGMKARLKKGYRTLFYGPPGTGKTFTAGLLGKYTERRVYKIDLSMVVSKYIGETEKNLELLFARAEDKGWILFFDEADALFGKRTNVRDAHDKYANQEVSYLLQRIENYNGLIILATNMKNNIDDAFIRRFNSILKFSFPDASQRALIWRKSFPQKAVFRQNPIVMNGNLSSDYPAIYQEPIDIPEAVKKYELTGGNILNVVHYAGIKAIEKLTAAKSGLKDENVTTLNSAGLEQQSHSESQLVIYLSDVMYGIRRELIKEGKAFSI